MFVWGLILDENIACILFGFGEDAFFLLLTVLGQSFLWSDIYTTASASLLWLMDILQEKSLDLRRVLSSPLGLIYTQTNVLFWVSRVQNSYYITHQPEI